jgi:hypothetical protein
MYQMQSFISLKGHIFTYSSTDSREIENLTNYSYLFEE